MKERLVVAACLVLCLALFVSGASGIVTPKAEPPEQKGPVVLSIKELEPLVEVAPQPVETEAHAKPEEPEISLTDAEVEMLACAIYQEAGGDACCDLCRYRVGDVILNRMKDERFPDTVEEVLTAYRQYGRFYWTGVKWADRADQPGEAHAVARAKRIAKAIASGEHSDLYGEGYVFQAEFEQGTGVLYCENCGIYFGR